MTPLQQRMLEDLQLRGLSARTQEAYVRAVRQRAAHYHTSPARITEEELRQYVLSAPHLLEAGVNLRLIQDAVGHTTPTTTAISTPLTDQSRCPGTQGAHRAHGRPLNLSGGLPRSRWPTSSGAMGLRIAPAAVTGCPPATEQRWRPWSSAVPQPLAAMAPSGRRAV